MPTPPDAAEFDAYVSARGSGLLRFAYVLCGDHHLAEDLVQEALVRVHRRWSKVQRTDQPGTYVRKAILRQYLSWRRRRSSGETPEDLAEDSAQKPDHAQGLADRDALWDALSGLPPKQRAVLVLRFYEDLDDNEIAAYVGCSAQTVRSHASRGVARLRGIVRADHFV
ncbi:SigE family RNA polymerase sigma factor [Cryptosporangium minutisporangium]|uniref:SigE family RNA polymerase sigma factor n=1 Tax=Cryptosporangium minutisporangium TaxID=113569 RepID=A0ABP6T2W2_9ACTN